MAAFSPKQCRATLKNYIFVVYDFHHYNDHFTIHLGPQLTDVCSDIEYTTTGVTYITSPHFPQMYPPHQHCTCDLTTDHSYLELTSVFFLLKAARPCEDWVTIQTDNGAQMTECGYVSETMIHRGRRVRLTFHSDMKHQGMGFWYKVRSKCSI